MYNETVQDVTAILENNAALRSERSGMDRYKKAMFGKHLLHTMTVPLAFIEKMRNGQCCPDGKSYDMWADHDHDERKQAMLHIQLYHPEWMTVTGKPIGKKQKWL